MTTLADVLVDTFRAELIDLIGYVISESLVDDQNIPARRSRGNDIVVLQSDYWDSAPRLQRNIAYAQLHSELVEARAYDLRFLDGAIVQMQYEFSEKSGGLLRSRAAFLPAPDLTAFQEQPDLYLLDEVYGDVIDLRVVAVPLRFDFDSRPTVAKDLHHPQSHLTLGQYPHCRVALTSAITPYYFMELILRSFYRTKDWLCTDDLPAPRVRMNKTITAREESLVHLGLPLGVL